MVMMISTVSVFTGVCLFVIVFLMVFNLIRFIFIYLHICLFISSLISLFSIITRKKNYFKKHRNKKNHAPLYLFSPSRFVCRSSAQRTGSRLPKQTKVRTGRDYEIGQVEATCLKFFLTLV